MPRAARILTPRSGIVRDGAPPPSRHVQTGPGDPPDDIAAALEPSLYGVVVDPPDAPEKEYDAQFKAVFDAIPALMAPRYGDVRPPIGFRSRDENDRRPSVRSLPLSLPASPKSPDLPVLPAFRRVGKTLAGTEDRPSILRCAGGRELTVEFGEARAKVIYRRDDVIVAIVPAGLVATQSIYPKTHGFGRLPRHARSRVASTGSARREAPAAILCRGSSTYFSAGTDPRSG